MPELARRFLRPREGWIAFFLLCVMLLSLTWSVQSAEWLTLLDYIGPVAIWGAVLGLVLGLLPISVAIVIPIAAVLGAAVVLWAVGGEWFPLLGQVDRYAAWLAGFRMPARQDRVAQVDGGAQLAGGCEGFEEAVGRVHSCRIRRIF